MMQLHALVRRKEGMAREDFLHYWHNVHGPLIRDTPALADRLLRYEQHPSHPKDRSGFDGVAVQHFATWDDFLAMLDGPHGEAMSNDEANFIGRKDIVVVFTEDPIVMVDGTERSDGPDRPGRADRPVIDDATVGDLQFDRARSDAASGGDSQFDHTQGDA